MTKFMIKFATISLFCTGFALATQNIDRNSTTNSPQVVENSELRVFFHGGKTPRDKFIIGDKFVASYEVIANIDEYLSHKFRDEKEFNAILEYNIYKLSIEKNHGDYWTFARVEWSLKDDKMSKTIDNGKVIIREKTHSKKVDEIYDNFVKKIASEIYESVNSTKQTNNENGGVILPFDK